MQLKDLAKIERKNTEDDHEDDGGSPMDEASAFIDAIKDIIEDFDGGFSEIAESLQPHIGTEDIILTFGYSKLVLACFQLAKEKEK